MKKTRVFQWFTSLKVSFSVGSRLEGECRTLFFFDTSKPPFDPRIILDKMFWGHLSSLIVAFCSGKSSGFVRGSISKNGGLGELLEKSGVEWSSYAPQYPSSRPSEPHYSLSKPELFIYYHGKVDNWDLFKDARRLKVS